MHANGQMKKLSASVIPRAAVLLAILGVASLLVRQWASPQVAAAPPGPAHLTALPTAFGGVRHYSIPGSLEIPGSKKADSGLLHLYLKALRWPDRHWRVKGFAFFEPTVQRGWRGVAIHNPPSAFYSLRMGVRSITGGWEREIALEYNLATCQRGADPRKYAACLESLQRNHYNFTTALPVRYGYADISLDLGADINSTDFELFVYGWQRTVSLAMPLLDALTKPPVPAWPEGTLPAFYDVLPFFKTVDPAYLAQLLAWRIEYHGAVGFDGIVLYVLPVHVAALEAEPGIQRLMRRRQLRLVVWDDSATLKGWRDPYLMVQQSHSALSFWGQHVRLLIADIDEFVVPMAPRQTLQGMFADGCLSGVRTDCLHLARQKVFARPEDAEPPSRESELWQAAGRNPLLAYHVGSGFGPTKLQEHGKLLVNPNRIVPITIHFSAACTGTSDVADGRSKAKLRSDCSQRLSCLHVQPARCAWVAHVVNMHGLRYNHTNESLSPIEPHDWLWMLHREH